MDKSAGYPPDVPYDSQGNNPGFYNQPAHGAGAPPPYSDNPYPQAGTNPPPGQGYAPGYGYPQQPYGAPPGQTQGYPQQFHQTNTNVVVAQPLMYQQAVTGPPPPDHMCSAIFVTLCCFWPTGIVAIMRASDARAALSRNDLATAHAHARSAKSMITISIIVGIISIIVAGVIIGVYVGLVVNSISNRYD